MNMAAKRIILNFEEQVYCDESRVWYVLDYQVTPFVRDVISDVVKHLKCCEGWNLYVNDVLAPEWTLSSVICSENDCVKLIRSKKSIPCHDADDSTELADPSEKVITIRDTKLVEAKSVNQSNATMENISDQQKPLKINNNFKRKFCDTTPTHKDRYTNRSKIYVSPVLPKTVPVANALKTAVKETLTYSSPIQAKRDGTSNCKTVTDSFHKARTFQDKVTDILNRNSTNSQVDSDCDSSMTSSSSENDSSKRVVKKLKTDPKSNPTHSQSLPCTTGKILKKPAPSSSSDTESEPETNKDQPTNNKKDSSSESSEDDTENQSQKIDITKPGCPSKKESSDDSTEDESGEEDSNHARLHMQPKVIEDNDQSKKIKSDSSSESDSDQEESSAKDKNSKVMSQKCDVTKDSEDDDSSDDESCEEDTKSTSIAEKNSDPPPGMVGQNSVGKDYNNCANLEGTPRVSDRLAFKMLDLNESYCPVISAYKEGVITAYNSSSQSIVVKLLPQFQKAKQKNGKFEMHDSFTSDIIELSLKQLIEPKLIV